MNLYLRYFDREVLVDNVDEAIAFLSGISEIGMNADLESDIRSYAESNNNYPKRYKVRPRVYFIIIKTAAQSMAEFKENRTLKSAGSERRPDRQETQLETVRFGWYEGQLDFKRVLPVPQTGKFQYKDTRFVARCKAESGRDCYNRIIEHLSCRVDPRSQFPSAKGKSFRFAFLGRCK